MKVLASTLLSLLVLTAPLYAEPVRDVYALIVTSNRASALGRPELRYADDDGAKYYELFTTLTSEDRVTLLTDFDRDTAQLYPALTKIADAPKLDRVRVHFDKLAEDVRRSQAAGHVAELYFVFAGHGDVDHGRGFLDLADAPLPADELERLLGSVASNRTHVIIDSCNSFFVIAPRKPGGRRFATPADAAESLSRRLPRVGVFLSTSAEAEVFEWSELQSGIFSHAVRSGLSGAADANEDGEVSYDELAAFVTVASRKVKNPLFRPQVFARGPGGNNRSALVGLPSSGAAILTLPAGPQLRVTVRDRDEIPVVDVHKAAGLAMQIRLSSRVAAGAVVDEHALSGPARIVRRRALPMDAHAQVQLSDAKEAPIAARGPTELLRALFTEPFDQEGVDEYIEDARTQPPAMGVSIEYAERLRTLLGEMHRHERSQRIIGGVALGAAAASFIVPGAIEIARSQYESSRVLGGVFVGLGSLLGLGSALAVAIPSKPMRLASTFERRYHKANLNLTKLVADTERDVLLLERGERAKRVVTGVFGGLVLVAGAVLSGVLGREEPIAGISGVLPIAGGATLLAESCFESPLERLIRQWRGDPVVTRTTLRPLFNAGATVGSVGLGGSF